MLRSKREERSEYQLQIKLKNENRQLKILQRQHENTLFRYGQTSVDMQQILITYTDDLKMMHYYMQKLKNKLRKSQDDYKQQNTELLEIKKNYKHLLDLSKNKQLEEREKLSSHLEENKELIKELDKNILALTSANENQKKNYQIQLAEETNKVKKLQIELKNMTDQYKKLQSQMEILKFKSYGGRRSFVRGMSGCYTNDTSTSKITTLERDKDKIPKFNKNFIKKNNSIKPQNTNVPRKSLKTELSNISDTTRDMQLKLMRQVHGDVIEKPKILLKKKSTNTSILPWNNRDIFKLLKEREIESLGEKFIDLEDKLSNIINPFSVSDVPKNVKTKTSRL
ncbi:uncharacterized protein LOC126899501 isoform X2 [Daktulosphaira vitifoliae]|uniref:uncharacterized protein LOC126899501 isoform X2 n=1 Tax=Daktulosphaira vitifoliae TaxID=58002 RepID=UPI0021AAE404|nr:uncharacterized protein LOC126899501 isoform X2 [Daktulosphaira vitifoliae]